MASAAEQLARNLNFSTFSKAKALQQRIWFTLGALLVYRLGTFIPVPGIDPDAFRATFEQSQQGIIGSPDQPGSAGALTGCRTRVRPSRRIPAGCSSEFGRKRVE